MLTALMTLKLAAAGEFSVQQGYTEGHSLLGVVAPGDSGTLP